MSDIIKVSEWSWIQVWKGTEYKILNHPTPFIPVRLRVAYSLEPPLVYTVVMRTLFWTAKIALRGSWGDSQSAGFSTAEDQPSEDIWNLNCAARKTRHQNAAANSAHCILFNFFLPRLIYDQFTTSLWLFSLNKSPAWHVLCSNILFTSHFFARLTLLQ